MISLLLNGIMQTLPELPRTLNRQESKFSIIFRRWWEANPLPGEIELKDTRGKNYLAFSEVSDEQIIVGTKAGTRKGILVRCTVGTTGRADYSGLVNSLYWVVIRYPTAFHVISLEAFLMEKKRSARKSLTSERAESIATITVHS